VRLLSRNSNDLADHFPLAAVAIEALPVKSCVIDGEAIVCNDNGLAVFDLIRDWRHNARAVLCAFDCWLATGVPKRIHEFNPNSRLIYVMRDPVERAISHYWHQVRWHGEHRPLSGAIRNDSRYRDVSYYAMQLAPYLELFARDQIKTLTFEELINKTEPTVTAIFRWLNVDHSTAFETVPPENVTPELIEQRRAFWGLHDKHRFLQTAIDSSPKSVRGFARQVARRKVMRSRVDASDIVDYLRPFQRKQTTELTLLLGREFPEWTTLYAR
jgi:hypothetical protein